MVYGRSAGSLHSIGRGGGAILWAFQHRIRRRDHRSGRRECTHAQLQLPNLREKPVLSRDFRGPMAQPRLQQMRDRFEQRQLSPALRKLANGEDAMLALGLFHESP